MINNRQSRLAGESAKAMATANSAEKSFRRFRLILDYPRQRIILEPNEHLAEPVEEDMSGFELVAEGKA